MIKIKVEFDLREEDIKAINNDKTSDESLKEWIENVIWDSIGSANDNLKISEEYRKELEEQ